MNFSETFKSICLPSKVYFVLSFAGILLSLISPAVFGGVSFLVHLIHIGYVVFWTWILDLICKAGYSTISWILVFFPFIVIFMFVVLFVGAAEVSQLKRKKRAHKEQYTTSMPPHHATTHHATTHP